MSISDPSAEEAFDEIFGDMVHFLRSAYSIAERRGVNTDWEKFSLSVFGVLAAYSALETGRALSSVYAREPFKLSGAAQTPSPSVIDGSRPPEGANWCSLTCTLRGSAVVIAPVEGPPGGEMDVWATGSDFADAVANAIRYVEAKGHHVTTVRGNL